MANPNPNRDGLKNWEKGESGNPGGKTSKQRKAEIHNAERATAIRRKLLDAMHNALIDDKTALQFIESAALKLIKDAEDRGLGAPRQEHTSPDGSMSMPRTIELIAPKQEPDESAD